MGDFKFTLQHHRRLTWPHSPNWRGHDSFSLFSHFILYLQKCFPLKTSERLEHFRGGKAFCFLTFKWNQMRNFTNSSCQAVIYEHKCKAKISIKSRYVLRGFKFVHFITGKEKKYFIPKSSECFSCCSCSLWFFFCPWTLNVRSCRSLKRLFDCSILLA